VETLVALTPDVIATGSEDGIIRVMQIQPNKLRKCSSVGGGCRHRLHQTFCRRISVGAIASHGDFPIERIKLDRNGKFLGSVSHDDCLKLTDVSEILEDSDDEAEAEDDDDAKSVDTVKGKSRAQEDIDNQSGGGMEGDSPESDDDSDADEHGSTAMETSDDEQDPAERKRQKRKERTKRKEQEKAEQKANLIKPQQQDEPDKGFFDDL
jgi:hypothetical protein